MIPVKRKWRQGLINMWREAEYCAIWEDSGCPRRENAPCYTTVKNKGCLSVEGTVPTRPMTKAMLAEIILITGD